MTISIKAKTIRPEYAANLGFYTFCIFCPSRWFPVFMTPEFANEMAMVPKVW